MLNQTKRVFTHKSKSKILLTILCIFGLLFSWSCSCKNRVTGVEGEKNYVPKTYTATRSGDTLIVVNTGGDGIKLAATISFANAKVNSVTVDVGATGIAADVFKYENGSLTMTEFGGVTTSRQKVTATFSLAPNDSRDTLINPTETVEIEVVKATRIDVGKNWDNNKPLGETLASLMRAQPSANFLFSGGEASGSDSIIDENAGTITLKNRAIETKDDETVSREAILSAFKSRMSSDTDIKKYFGDSGVSDFIYVPDTDTKAANFTFSVTPLPEYEYDVTDWKLKLTTEKGSFVE